MDSWNAVLTIHAKKFFAESAKLFCSKCEKKIKIKIFFKSIIFTYNVPLDEPNAVPATLPKIFCSKNE